MGKGLPREAYKKFYRFYQPLLFTSYGKFKLVVTKWGKLVGLHWVGLTFVLVVEMVDTLAPGDLVTCAI